jgi:transposase
LKKKRVEGKHYYVAISHVVKKLVRVIFHLEKTNERYSTVV